MGKIAWALGRIVLSIAIGLATFWPDHGIAFQVFRYYPTNPIATMFIAQVWVGVLALTIPMPRRAFQVATTICLIGILSLGILQAQHFRPDLFYHVATWVVCAIIIVFAALGWQRIATGLWRWAHGVAPVEDAEAYSDL